MKFAVDHVTGDTTPLPALLVIGLVALVVCVAVMVRGYRRSGGQ